MGAFISLFQRSSQDHDSTSDHGATNTTTSANQLGEGETTSYDRLRHCDPLKYMHNQLQALLKTLYEGLRYVGIAAPESISDPRDIERSPKTQLFGLIIGINDYANVKKLGGAVADAQEWKKYLRRVLRVPDDQLRTLLDRDATRDKIIKALQDLRDDKRIKRGNPIVIFYAGHGGTCTAPEDWGYTGQIQFLVPQDYKSVNMYEIPGRTTDRPTEDIPKVKGNDIDYRAIHAIPDRTIGTLIEDIAKEKGDNITLVFDCCHSASMARGAVDENEDENEDHVPRFVDLDPIPTNLDDNIWGSRDGSVPNGFTYHGLRAYVLLAACRAEERAFETSGRGCFTTALLTKLKNSNIDELSYAELLDTIRLTKQRPQCEGSNRHRLIFNTTVSAATLYPVNQVDGSNLKHVIGAGLAHGVSKGAEFTLYKNRESKSLGIVVVDTAASIEDFETTITLPPYSDGVSLAKLTLVNKLRIYLTPGGNMSSLLKATDKNNKNARKFEVVNEINKAKLKVVKKGNRAIFTIVDRRINSFGLTDLPSDVSLENLARVLDAAAHYFSYLDLRNDHTSIGTDNEITVDFYSLKSGFDKYGLPLHSPNGSSFCRKGSDNLDVINFIVDPNALYGIEIKNNTPRDLYLNAFLFNTSSLSIVPYYTQSNAGHPSAPLKRGGGTFAIGYGPEGGAPFSYSLKPGQNVDVGYLKIFFASRPIDLSNIKQTSPFSDQDPSSESRDGDRAPESQSARDIWFTVLIPVVQNRK